MNEYLACYHSFPGWDGSLWTAPPVVWALIVSDLGIFAAYIFIGWGLMRYAFTRNEVIFRDLTVLFALFIGFCGMTHGVKVAVLFVPAFWAEAVVQWITLVFSSAAAIVWFFKYKNMVDYNQALEAFRASFLKQKAELEVRLERIEREVK